MFDPDGCSCPLNISACANIERAICSGVCHYLSMALHMPKSLKPDTPGVTLRPRGREAFVAPIEAVRMDKTPDATAQSGSMPHRPAIDARTLSLTFATAH